MKKYKKHLLSILAIAAFIIIALGSEEKASTPLSDEDKLLAYNFAEDFVKEELKTVTNIEFPNNNEQEEHTLELVHNEYLIVSGVEHLNKKGESAGSEFSCKIFFENDKAILESLVINE